MNVLVLGATGMLGSMVYHYLKNNSDFNIVGTSRGQHTGLLRFNVFEGFENSDINLENLDYVINCIGITKPYCRDDNMIEVKNAIIVNSLFPRILAELAERKGFKVIQIATDCVFSGNNSQYAEDSSHDSLDVYGKTKSLGEVISKIFLNIRCSIIGPEKFNKVFLLEWFLKQPPNVSINGYYDHLWNGVTTLQFANLCYELILQNAFDTLVKKSNLYHFAPNDIVSKYTLLCLFNKIFEKGLVVNKTRAFAGPLNRTLVTNYNILEKFFHKSSIEEEIKRLKKYIEETDFYGDRPAVF